MFRHLSIVNRVEELSRVLHFVSEIADELKLDEEKRMEMELVLEEMVANVIFYAYPKGVEDTIELTAKSDGHTLTLVVGDHGKAFDPTLTNNINMKENPAERPIGGMGIHIVRNLMNDMHYQRLNGQNLLTMTALLSQPVKHAKNEG